MHPQTDGGTSKEDDRLAKHYNNPCFGELEEPATVLDRHGRIILWSLPFISSRYRMVVILILSLLLIRGLTLIQNDLGGATVTVRCPLDLFIKSLGRDSKTASWRHSLFHPPSGGGVFGAGVLNMSPGWFQQSQDVGFVVWFIYKAYSYIVSATF